VSAGEWLCFLDEVPDNGARGFFQQPDSGRFPVFVVRRGGIVRVYRDECPHQGVQMAWRAHAYLNRDASRIVCWAHGAQFEIETGVCTLGPCLGQRLRAVAHRVGSDGGLWIIEPRG
jgi:nitrite reductase/ring-hydroxylating ferredoxin subunit